MTTFPSTPGSSDTGLAVPRGIPMRIFCLADSTGLTVPSSAWVIPAAPQPEKANGHDRPASIGHNSGNTTPMADNNKDAKAAAIAEIRDWLANRLQRASDYMTPSEIGAAENRLILLKHALIDGVAYIQRALNALDDDAKKRGTTLVAEVYVYSALFSDNGSGYSELAASRLARMLDCSVRAVKYARALLVEMCVLGREQRSGLESRYWPIINRKFASGYVHPTWWLDATSEPIRRGRQSGEPVHLSCTGLEEETGAPIVHGSGETRAPSVHVSKETRAPARKTRAPAFDQPIENKGNAGLEFTKEFTKTDSLSPDGEGVDASLFPDKTLSEGALPPSKVAPCKPAPSTADIKLAFGLYLETAERCRLPKHERVDPWVPNIKARLREHGLDSWKRMLAKVEASPFLRGERTKFRADLDWLSGPKNFAKVLSGKYDEQDKPKPKMLTRY